MQYEEFLKSKMAEPRTYGFEPAELNPNLKDFQAWTVTRAIRAGKYAILYSCGLGKSLMQLEWARQVYLHTGLPVLVLAPLGVVAQTIREGAKFGIECGRIGDASGIDVINYEQLDNINPAHYAGVVADEVSCIKNYSGATKKKLVEMFAKTPYKLACSATPSPNDNLEFGSLVEFLDVCTGREMIAMFFTHDASDSQKWILKGHGEKAFYEFISTFAAMIEKPSDIGFSDDGYVLPPLKIVERKIITPKRDNGSLFNDEAVSATNFNAELRLTKIERMEQVSEIVNSSPDQFIVWVKQNDEAELITKMIPGAVNVHGGMSSDDKESKLLGFANGEFRVLVTKSKIAQFGLNFQNCHNQVFASLDFSFEALYQSIRRSYRFGQKESVNIYLITTDTMANVIEAITRKQAQFDKLQSEMRIAINKNIQGKKLVETEYNVEAETTDLYSIKCGDSCQLMKDIPSESVHYSFFSPPFAALYTYSDDVRDLSNVKDNEEFMRHFDFIVSELYRVIKPGRLVSMHLTQLTTGIGRDGYLSIVDFRGDIIRLFQKHGFYFHAEVTVWKDPELAAVRTKNIQLLHKQTKKDSTISRPGLADYIVTLRKPGENTDPVCHNGSGLPFDVWTKIASPVWMDVNESDTLHFRSAKDKEDVRHITPTQLKVIERSLELWTNPGDTVLTPFMGIGSEVYTAVKMGRYGIGFELKESYFQQAKQNIQLAVNDKKQLALL